MHPVELILLGIACLIMLGVLLSVAITLQRAARRDRDRQEQQLHSVYNSRERRERGEPRR